jgi:hypothetical protein
MFHHVSPSQSHPHPKKSRAHQNRTFLGDEEVLGLQVSMTNHVHVDVGNSTPGRSAGKGPKETRERDRNFFEKVPESSSIPKSLDRLDSTKKESRNTCRVCENNLKVALHMPYVVDSRTQRSRSCCRPGHDLLEEQGSSVFVEGTSLQIGIMGHQKIIVLNVQNPDPKGNSSNSNQIQSSLHNRANVLLQNGPKMDAFRSLKCPPFGGPLVNTCPYYGLMTIPNKPVNISLINIDTGIFNGPFLIDIFRHTRSLYYIVYIYYNYIYIIIYI